MCLLLLESRLNHQLGLGILKVEGRSSERAGRTELSHTSTFKPWLRCGVCRLLIPLAKASHVANPKVKEGNKHLLQESLTRAGKSQWCVRTAHRACSSQFFNFRNLSNWFLKHQYLEISHNGNIYSMEVGNFYKSDLSHPKPVAKHLPAHH